MNASLYISDQSFAFNGVDTDIEVAHKIADLNDLWKYLHGSEDLKRKNIFYIQPKNFLSTKITNTLQICDLLEGKGDRVTFRDTVNLFISILSKGTRVIQSSTNEGLQEYLQLRDEDNDCALVVLTNLKISLTSVSRYYVTNVIGWNFNVHIYMIFLMMHNILSKKRNGYFLML